MLDTTSPPLAMTPAWRDHLSPGDIALYAFPVCDPDRATPKARPCLVLEIRQWAGERYALLAYGTSSETTANRGLDIHVADHVHYPQGGLDESTRFVARRRLLVNLDALGFALSSRIGSPVIGRIDGPALARMHRIRARLQAEADMAAERRESARRAHQGRRAEARRASTHPVAVERRQPLPKVLPGASERLVPSPTDGAGRRTGTLVLTSSTNLPTDGAAQ